MQIDKMLFNFAFIQNKEFLTFDKGILRIKATIVKYRLLSIQ